MLSKSRLINPYALPLQDAQREYKQIFDKKIWRFADVCRLEQLNGKIQRLKLLVRVYDARS